LAPSLREQRLRLAWLLAVPFLVVARPTPALLAAGMALALPGLVLRALAAARIHKDRYLAVGGPYAHIRHPLYVGSGLVGLGLAVAGGRWWLAPLFLALFLGAYRRTVRAEESELEARFGAAYRAWRAHTPAVVPWPGARVRGPVDPSAPAPGSPAPGRPLYRRNKEWQAALGTATGFALLWLRMVLAG
jgi:hypothetical protein